MDTRLNTEVPELLCGLPMACPRCGLFRDGDDASASELEPVNGGRRGGTRRRLLRRRTPLYFAGDAFHSVYVVRSGSVKVCTVTDLGEERVIRFGFRGDVLGLEGICPREYANNAVALETTSVCAIPFRRLEAVAQEYPELQRQLMGLMSCQVVDEYQLRLALLKRTAEERLVVGLLSLSRRFAERGLSARRFRLSMSQGELGSYLGLAAETVSRMLRRFRENGWLSGEGREIVIEDWDALFARAGDSTEQESVLWRRARA